MSKQRPTSDKLANELLGASAFFRPASKPVEEQPAAAPLPAQPTETPEALPTSDVMTSRRRSVMTTSASLSSPDQTGFDINRPTTSRDSLRLSVDETKALDTLRQSLKWDHDVTVSKNDICRVALHWLLEDAAARGEKSEALKRLKRKQTGR